ncbi:RNI-like protein [Hymenopellis radicata]|nr:RNI-like protein [Hymenopellis radicata]
MAGLKEKKRAIEVREMERRARVVRGDSVSSSSVSIDGELPGDEWWSMDKVDSFYKECCAGCDEQPDPSVSAAFKHAATTNPRKVDLSGVQLTLTSASILSDVFTIEWGLHIQRILKPMLRSLLIPSSLTFLSVASNRSTAFRLHTSKIVHRDALKSPPQAGLASLRLDDCSLRPGALEALSRAVRTSSLRNISLRYNRINATGAVALALMIRDYPDVVPASPSSTNSVYLNSTASSQASSPASSVTSLPLSPPATPLPHVGPVLPPPRHPHTGLQTTYTPYVPRSKRGTAPAPQINPLSASGHPVPILTSSSQGGITARQSPLPSSHPHSGPSAALLDKVRALDALPRVGALRTLDLKGNDLKQGITFLAQVLKRNRTLKVLNLSENKLDSAGLVAIAEALKYNSSLETLDLSRNPCASGLEGIQSLRTAFTLNTALKRLFLSSTLLSSVGAIALAEFLPESTSLLHLDLTQNQLDLASVIALESGMKANRVLRCLDLDVPPGDEEFARCCRGILGSCVRNTEEAQKRAEEADGVDGGDSAGKKVWGILDDSELAKRIRMEETVGGDIVVRARASITQMHNILHPPAYPQEISVIPVPQEVAKRVRAIIEELGVVIQATEDPERMEELFAMHDELTELVGKGLGVRLNGLPSPRVSPRPSPLLMGSTIEEEDPSTPRIDKGKAKAEPEFEKVLSPTSALMNTNDKEEDEDSEGKKFPSVIPDEGEEGDDEEDENIVEHR